MQFLNIFNRGSIIAWANIFNMRILIISWRWALLISGFYYSVGGHFQYANSDHIMALSFTRVEFTDDYFNTIVREFNVYQVLIGNGISWWGENTDLQKIFNNWSQFCKNRINDISLFTKICNKFVIAKNSGDVRNLFVI